MNGTSQYGDLITTLQTDEIPPSSDEMQIVTALLGAPPTTNNKKENAKFFLLLFFLFMVFSLDPLKNLIERVIPVVKKSPYIDLAIRASLFIISVYILKTFVLKNKDV